MEGRSRAAHLFQTKVVNPLVRRRAGESGSRYALLETVGRRSGLPRVTPVADGLDGEVFWIVSERGDEADYVHNMGANPHVRIKVRGAWREGDARLAPEEDPMARLQRIDPRTASEIKRFGHKLASVRVDLKR